MGKLAPWRGVPRHPNFTMVPNLLFDELMREVTPAGWLVVCVVVRRTWGYQRPGECVALSLAQIAGETGLSTSTIKIAVKSLVDQGVLVTERSYDVARRVYNPTGYRLRYDDEGLADDRPRVIATLAENRPTPGRESANPQPGIGQGLGDDRPVLKKEERNPEIQGNKAAAALWAGAVDTLAQTMIGSVVEAYLAPARARYLTGDVLTLEATPFVAQALRGRLAPRLAAALTEAAGRPIGLDIREIPIDS